jgi:YD repeat-containing protein
MGVIFTKPKAGGAGGSGVFTQAEKLALEMEMDFKASNLFYYKEFTYDSTSELLITIEYYTDNGKGTKLFNKDLSYNPSDQLITSVLTRILDVVTMTKTLAYDGSGNLISITRT